MKSSMPGRASPALHEHGLRYPWEVKVQLPDLLYCVGCYQGIWILGTCWHVAHFFFLGGDGFKRLDGNWDQIPVKCRVMLARICQEDRRRLDRHWDGRSNDGRYDEIHGWFMMVLPSNPCAASGRAWPIQSLSPMHLRPFLSPHVALMRDVEVESRNMQRCRPCCGCWTKKRTTWTWEVRSEPIFEGTRANVCVSELVARKLQHTNGGSTLIIVFPANHWICSGAPDMAIDIGSNGYVSGFDRREGRWTRWWRWWGGEIGVDAASSNPKNWKRFRTSRARVS